MPFDDRFRTASVWGASVLLAAVSATVVARPSYDVIEAENVSKNPSGYVHHLEDNKASSTARQYTTKRIAQEQAGQYKVTRPINRPGESFEDHIKMHHNKMKEKMRKRHHEMVNAPKEACGGAAGVGELHNKHCVCHDGFKCAGPLKRCSNGMTPDGRWFTGFSIASKNVDETTGCPTCTCVAGLTGQSTHDSSLNQKDHIENRMHDVYSNGRTSSDLAAKQVHGYGTHANRNGEPRSRQPQQQMRQQQGAQSRAGFEEVDGHLTDYIPYFRTEGYVLVQDLLDADEEEMQAALAGAKMKRPQERRFKALIASAKDEAPLKNGA
eukprot:gene17618-18088_t